MLGSSLILVAALASAVLLFRRSEALAEAPQSQLQVSSLSLVFIALAAMGQLLLTPDNQDVATLQRLLGNLALYAGLPLLVTAVLALSMGWFWSKAGWGRWLLALFALFELLRRMGLGESYTLWLSVALAAALLVAAFKLPVLTGRIALALAAPLILLGISAGTIMTATPPALLPPLAQAAGLGLISFALLQHTGKRQPEQTG